MGGQSKINPWERRLGLAVVGLLLLGLVGAAAIRIKRIRHRGALSVDAPIETADVRNQDPAIEPAPATHTAVLEAQAREHDPLEASSVGKRPSWTQEASDGGDLVEEKQDNFMPKAVVVDGDEQPVAAADPPAVVADQVGGHRAPLDRRQAAVRAEPGNEPGHGGPVAGSTIPMKALSPGPAAASPRAARHTEPRDVAQSPAADSFDDVPSRATGSRYPQPRPIGEPATEAGAPAAEQQTATPRRVEPNSVSPARSKENGLTDLPRDGATGPLAGPAPGRYGRLPLRPGSGRPAASRGGSDVTEGGSTGVSATLTWTERHQSDGTGGREYRVQPGDSMWTIARDVYGSSAFFRALTAYNRSRHPEAGEMRAGDVVLIPTIDQLRTMYPNLSPTLRGGDVADAAPQPEASPRRWYLVEEGDTLYDIARFELGQSARWTEIVEMNRATVGDSFSKLRPGTRLLLPSNATSHPVATRPNRDARRY